MRYGDTRHTPSPPVINIDIEAVHSGAHVDVSKYGLQQMISDAIQGVREHHCGNIVVNVSITAIHDGARVTVR